MKILYQTVRVWAVAVLVLLLASACESDKPEGVIDQSTMENLLYDYHVAQALGRNHRDSTQYYTSVYQTAVFKKYNVTAAQFDESLEWYTRHSEELFDIYKNLNERLSLSSFSGEGGNLYSNMREGGDTTNVWQGGSFYLLSTHGRNYMTFVQEADTSYRANDRLLLHFNAQWVYREGIKQGAACLAVRYANDSIASVTKYLNLHNPQELTLQTDSLPIKSIFGFIYQAAEWTERPKFLVLTDVCLIRFHGKATSDSLQLRPELQPEGVQPAVQRTREQQIRDSLLRQDTLTRHPAPRTLAPLTTRRLRKTP